MTLTDKQIAQIRKLFGGPAASEPLDQQQTDNLRYMLAHCPQAALEQLAEANIPHVSKAAWDMWKVHTSDPAVGVEINPDPRIA